MESEDSDTDMSEDEADEDACGHMDKENQQPNDPHSVIMWTSSPNNINPPSPVTDTTEDVISLHTPLECFQKFVSEDMIQALVTNTNEYSFQKNGTSINTNTKEIEKLIGMYLKMGLVQMAGVPALSQDQQTLELAAEQQQ
ncbi:PiggyBac transposable element-derived protein 2 [Dissostichus eleginoides]|uniref:PiggyBac transposable element-derived protein 2 n=1 Tax=Dissostichus eleginoides TaxID=100907 RepID=A0AAD9F6F4_DISEL|nr:PiggyBac transposable element-derived protein 2 [Dissostichus eleginoides]